eukprot:12688499-Ditylum_brightwellii.AAC.1
MKARLVNATYQKQKDVLLKLCRTTGSTSDQSYFVVDAKVMLVTVSKDGNIIMGCALCFGEELKEAYGLIVD